MSKKANVQALLACIREGDAMGVGGLLRAGVDPNDDFSSKHVKVGAHHAIQTDGWRALHHAAYHGHVEIARLLLEAGARIDAEGLYKGTPLTMAARMGHAELTALLLAHGADPSPAMDTATPHLACLRLLVEAGADPALSVRGAVIDNHLESLRYLLERGADPRGIFAYESTDGRVVDTPRMAALHYRRHDCYRLLRGRPPYVSLSDAVADGNREEAETFLRAGASVEELDTYGRAALFWALRAGNAEMVQWLLDRGARIGFAGTFPTSPIDAALPSGAIGVFELLHGHGIDWKGALRAAVDLHDDATLRWLLANVPFDDDERKDAAWRCAANDDVDALKTLFEHGVAHGDLLVTAASYGSLGVVELLLARGADPHATYRGNTLLDLALEGPPSDDAYEFDEGDLEEPLAKRLLALGLSSKWLP